MKKIFVILLITFLSALPILGKNKTEAQAMPLSSFAISNNESKVIYQERLDSTSLRATVQQRQDVNLTYTVEPTMLIMDSVSASRADTLIKYISVLAVNVRNANFNDEKKINALRNVGIPFAFVFLLLNVIWLIISTTRKWNVGTSISAVSVVVALVFLIFNSYLFVL